MLEERFFTTRQAISYEVASSYIVAIASLFPWEWVKTCAAIYIALKVRLKMFLAKRVAANVEEIAKEKYEHYTKN